MSRAAGAGLPGRLPAAGQLLAELLAQAARGVPTPELAEAAARALAGPHRCCLVYLEQAGEVVLLAEAGPVPHETRGHLLLGEGAAGWVASHVRPLDLPPGDPRLTGPADCTRTRVRAVPAGSAPLVVVETHTGLGAHPPRGLLAAVGAAVALAARAQWAVRAREAEREEHGAAALDVMTRHEQERQRLAAELHDGVSQRVVSLAFQLSAAAQALREDPGFAERCLQAARRLAEEALVEIAAAVRGLRPPALDDLGLPAALEGLARDMAGATVHVRSPGRDVPAPVQTALYRVAQEALQNVVKHASATSVAITLDVGERWTRLRIDDDGTGFDPSARSGGYGLRGMAERIQALGGEVRIHSRPKQGTTVSVVVPSGLGS